MAKINYDYPLNPLCTNPKICGKKLSDRWFVYTSYLINGKRKQYKDSSGLNDKSDTITIRRKKAELARQDLEKNLLTRILDIRTNSFLKNSSETLSLTELIPEYLNEIKPNLTSYSYANYNTVFKSFIQYTKNLNVSHVDKSMIQDFINSFNIKPQSKRSYRIYISTFFNWLIDVKKLNIVNPTIGIKISRNEPVERHKVYSKEDIKRIIEYCDENNDIVLKTIIYLIYGAQVRISEILRIQIEDFKLTENKIVLPKGKAKIKNKSKTILLDEPLKQYLLNLPVDYNDSNNAKMFFIGIDKPYAKSAFSRPLQLSKNTIDTRFKQLKKNLNIGLNKTLYSFKHTGNVNLLINGADLIELMYKNGHTKISQTETYARQLIEQVPEMKYIRKKRDDLEFR